MSHSSLTFADADALFSKTFIASSGVGGFNYISSSQDITLKSSVATFSSKETYEIQIRPDSQYNFFLRFKPLSGDIYGIVNVQKYLDLGWFKSTISAEVPATINYSFETYEVWTEPLKILQSEVTKMNIRTGLNIISGFAVSSSSILDQNTEFSGITGLPFIGASYERKISEKILLLTDINAGNWQINSNQYDFYHGNIKIKFPITKQFSWAIGYTFYHLSYVNQKDDASKWGLWIKDSSPTFTISASF